MMLLMTVAVLPAASVAHVAHLFYTPLTVYLDLFIDTSKHSRLVWSGLVGQDSESQPDYRPTASLCPVCRLVYTIHCGNMLLLVSLGVLARPGGHYVPVCSLHTIC